MVLGTCISRALALCIQEFQKTGMTGGTNYNVWPISDKKINQLMNWYVH